MALDEKTALFEARPLPVLRATASMRQLLRGLCPDNAVIKPGAGRALPLQLRLLQGLRMCAAECHSRVRSAWCPRKSRRGGEARARGEVKSHGCSWLCRSRTGLPTIRLDRQQKRTFMAALQAHRYGMRWSWRGGRLRRRTTATRFRADSRPTSTSRRATGGAVVLDLSGSITSPARACAASCSPRARRRPSRGASSSRALQPMVARSSRSATSNLVFAIFPTVRRRAGTASTEAVAAFDQS